MLCSVEAEGRDTFVQTSLKRWHCLGDFLRVGYTRSVNSFLSYRLMCRQGLTSDARGLWRAAERGKLIH